MCLIACVGTLFFENNLARQRMQYHFWVLIVWVGTQCLFNRLHGDLQDHPPSVVKQELAEVFEPIRERVEPFLRQYRAAYRTGRPVIAVTGCSGVGKSYFSRMLCSYFNKMGIKTRILKYDDFFDPEPFEGAKNELHPRFDWLRAHAFIQKIVGGEEVLEKPVWDNTGPKPFKKMEVFDLRGIELLIVEGILALCDENTYDLEKYSDVRVLLDAEDHSIIDWDWRRARYLETDSITEFIKLRTRELSEYRVLLEAAWPHADFVIKKEGDHTYHISNLKGIG